MADIASKPRKDGGVEAGACCVKALELIMGDADYEINRDIFDGLDNEMRRVICISFFTQMLECISTPHEALLPAFAIIAGVQGKRTPGDTSYVPKGIAKLIQNTRKGGN